MVAGVALDRAAVFILADLILTHNSVSVSLVCNSQSKGQCKMAKVF